MRSAEVLSVALPVGAIASAEAMLYGWVVSLPDFF
jgi:hypothetical protein